MVTPTNSRIPYIDFMFFMAHSISFTNTGKEDIAISSDNPII
jgi:hypothetical protein